jgi:hypothetical protein
MYLYIAIVSLWMIFIEYIWESTGEKMTVTERVMNIVLFPLAFAIFFYTFIRSFFNK